MNALLQKKKKIVSLVLKKKNIYIYIYILSLLVDDCILMYLEITFFCIYNFFNTIWMSI